MGSAPCAVMIDHEQATKMRANGGYSRLAVPNLPERDVRRKRPPLLVFLLRMETLRRLIRVISLLGLDFLGVTGALFTAIAIKLALKGAFTVSFRAP